MTCTSLRLSHEEHGVRATTHRRQVPERQRAVQQFCEFAKPYRFRVVLDAEGLPMIPGRYGEIESYRGSVKCLSCALPGQFALAVLTDRPRPLEKRQCGPYSRLRLWSRWPQ